METHRDRSWTGPAWWWVTAWSLQGTCVLGIEQLQISSPVLRFGAIGAAAALPLAGLFLAVRARRPA